MVEPGTILGGKYQVERVLGQGGMGCVVAAVHLQLGQRVAIKFLLPEALRHPEAVERFLREARAAVRLRSEHVGRVIDVGQFDDGAPYMVMEFLEGMDLQGYLARMGPLPPDQSVDYVLQACEAIAEAHALGIVHRDLKPANLFLTRRADGNPLIKVLDFGISKAAAGDQSFNMTRTASVIGSPGYMSPEQLRSAKDCDARTDVWALGVILYELTSGRQPFTAESITELALRVAIDPAPPLSVPGLPAGFEDAVMRCLAKDADERYQNVAELAAALVPFGPPGSQEAAARVARVLQINPATLRALTAPVVAGTPTTLTGAAGTFGDTTAGKPRRTGMIAGVAVTLALAGGAVLALTMGGGKEEGGEPAPTAKPGPDPRPPPPAIDAGVATATPVDAAAAPAPDAAVVEADAKDPPRKKRPPRKKDPRSGSDDDDDEDLSDSRY